jgi:hypothetical protein
VITRLFGPKGEKVAGDLRRLHNEELRILYVSPILFGLSNQGGCDERDVYVHERGKNDEIKSRLNSGNACYHSVQNLLSSHLISK